MITMAIQCMHFERRLCWMLASLLEQTKRDELIVDAAFMEGSGCKPEAKEVVQFFHCKGLDMIPHGCTNYGLFQQRGRTRNVQLNACPTEWIWFADADHVYHPMYVENLMAELEKHKAETRLLTAGRMSTQPPGRSPFEFNADVPVYHQAAWQWCSNCNVKRMGAPGAGHTQIVRCDNLPDREYVPDDKCKDHHWDEKHTKARSDQQFRHKVGGKVGLPKWFTYNQIHLNHPRDKDEGMGRHLTVQR